MKRILLAMVLALATVGTQAQLLYRITGNGLGAPSYIVGTYHLAPVSEYHRDGGCTNGHQFVSQQSDRTDGKLRPARPPLRQS